MLRSFSLLANSTARFTVCLSNIEKKSYFEYAEIGEGTKFINARQAYWLADGAARSVVNARRADQRVNRLRNTSRVKYAHVRGA